MMERAHCVGSATVDCSPHRLQAVVAFSAAPIFSLDFFIIRSVHHDGIVDFQAGSIEMSTNTMTTTSHSPGSNLPTKSSPK
jgi:hypothetical protein